LGAITPQSTAAAVVPQGVENILHLSLTRNVRIGPSHHVGKLKRRTNAG
jgi:hypothetical protein